MMPDRLAQLGRRLGALLHRGRMERELAEEMRFHLEMRQRDHAAAGLGDVEARDAARRRFGNPTYLAEESRAMWSVRWLESLGQDLRYGLRSLRRAPGYTLVAIAALALGIGANSAVFSVVYGVLLRPLGYASPEQLVSIYSPPARQRTLRVPPSYPDFVDWRARSGVLAGAAFARGDLFSLLGREGRERILGAYVSDGFFPLLGVGAERGRTFAPDEERPGGPPVVVLSHGAWVRRFGGDPAIVGRDITLDDRRYTVIGVMPAAFAYPIYDAAVTVELWTPLAAALATDASLAKRDYRVDNMVVGRLKPGTSVAHAQASFDVLARALGAEYPATNRDVAAFLQPVRDQAVGNVRQSLVVLWASVAAVLLIAAANVTSLALARAAARGREMAVRSALGAGRARLARQLVTESAILAMAGGALGLLLAWAGVRALVAAAPANLPRLGEVRVDATVLVFTVGLSLLVALAVGTVPALHAGRGQRVADALRGGARGGVSRGARRLRAVLVVAEVAMALALLAGAGLLLASFQRLRGVPLGFDVERLIALRISPPAPRYASPAATLALYDRLRAEVAAVPGVERVAYVNHMELGMGNLGTPVGIDGRAPLPEDSAGALFRVASAGYLATLGVPVLAGRDLADADMRPVPTTVVVNEAFARAYFQGRPALGQRITVYRQAVSRPDYGKPIDAEIVGVAGDVLAFGPGSTAAPEVFVPITGNVWPTAYLVARTRGRPAPMSSAVRRAITRVDAEIPVGDLTTISAVLDAQLERPRLSARFLGVFALVAVLLAASGLYGLLAYLVSQRTRELGVRMALGAGAGDVVRLVVREGMLLVALGIALGLALSAASSRLLAGLLFEVAAGDPVIHAGVAVLLTAVGLAAVWGPARRAARVEPMEALRSD